MPRMVYAFVALVLPLIVKVDVLVEELLELSAVLIDRIDGHYLTHVSLSRWIADLACTAAQQEYRCMTVLLHVHHGDHRNEVSDVQAVCCRVESDVEFDFLISEQFSELLRIRALRNQSSLYENIVYVCVLAYIIRDK